MFRDIGACKYGDQDFGLKDLVWYGWDLRALGLRSLRVRDLGLGFRAEARV